MTRLYWIDTSTMIADPLTKHMNSERLAQALASGYLDLEPTAKSKAAKAAKSKQRSKTEATNEASEHVSMETDAHGRA